MKFSLVSFAGGAMVTMILGGVLVASASVVAISWPGTPAGETASGQFAWVLRKMLLNSTPLDDTNNGYVQFAQNASSLATWSGTSSQIMKISGNDIQIGTNWSNPKVTISSTTGNFVTSGSISTAANMNIAGNLRVWDDIRTSSGVTATAFLYSSDERLKKDISPIKDPSALLSELRGVNFTWRDSGRSDIGLIAQEVEKVVPEVVHTDEQTGMKSVEYGNLVAVLIEAMKEQQKQIDHLQSEIQSIRSAR